MNKKLREALKESGLQESDIKTLIEEFDAAVEEGVKAKLEQKEKVLEEAAEEFADKKTEEKVAEKTEELTDETEKDLAEFKEATEDKLVESLDKCIDIAIKELQKEFNPKQQALLETFEPIVNGVKALFGQHGLTLDESGEKRLEKLEENLSVLEGRLNKSVEENIYLKESNDKLLKQNWLIGEASKAGISEKSFQKLETLTETLTFEETKKASKKYLEILTESEITDPELDGDEGEEGITDGSTADEADLDDDLTGEGDEGLEDEPITETKKNKGKKDLKETLDFRGTLSKMSQNLLG